MSASRGPRVDYTIVRLGCEGVPVNVIARATLKAGRYVRMILMEAKADGLIGRMPAADWPEGRRLLPAAPAAFDPAAIDPVAARLQAFVGLTRSQSRLVAALLVLGTVARPTLRLVISAKTDATDKLVDVVACKARQRLKRLRVVFVTVWGTGFHMSEPNRARLRAALDAGPRREPVRAAAA